MFLGFFFLLFCSFFCWPFFFFVLFRFFVYFRLSLSSLWLGCQSFFTAFWARGWVCFFCFVLSLTPFSVVECAHLVFVFFFFVTFGPVFVLWFNVFLSGSYYSPAILRLYVGFVVLFLLCFLLFFGWFFCLFCLCVGSIYIFLTHMVWLFDFGLYFRFFLCVFSCVVAFFVGCFSVWLGFGFLHTFVISFSAVLIAFFWVYFLLFVSFCRIVTCGFFFLLRVLSLLFGVSFLVVCFVLMVLLFLSQLFCLFVLVVVG